MCVCVVSSHQETLCTCGRGPQPQRTSSSSDDTAPETGGRGLVLQGHAPVWTVCEVERVRWRWWWSGAAHSSGLCLSHKMSVELAGIILLLELLMESVNSSDGIAE